MLVAILAMESIACVQYFYTRATIKADAVYRAQSELRSAEQEINTAAVELEAAAKMLAKMAEFCLNNPDAMPGCVSTLLETLESVEGAGIAFVPDYFPKKGHWYEVYGTRNDRTEKGFAVRQIGGLGIHLVRQLMDEIRYERVEGKNILTLVKKVAN